MAVKTLMIECMMYFFLICSSFCIIRIIRGPRAADRLAGLNVLSGAVLAVLVLHGVRQERSLYLDVALVYDIFGFLGFLAVGKFLREWIEKKDEDELQGASKSRTVEGKE